MKEDAFTDQLSDYIDRELEPEEREALENHLEQCTDCRIVLAELRGVRREAKTLTRHAPPERAWASIAESIRTGQRARSRRSYFQSGLAAAAAVVLGVSLFVALRPSREIQMADLAQEDPAALANLVTEELRSAETHYENAITGLEQIIELNDGTLPSALNGTMTESLDLIEQAIHESREAMATEPGSLAAQESLLEAFRRKVELLQKTILLINEVRKGEGQNALDLIDEIRGSDDPTNPIG
ncbi:MAG: hypothetical protein E2P02_24885 [Acidobacteria bacterium]|nr:MAG: hypothetical protein E2P02_24885 [Acidobacteriota bacterium]